MWQFIRNKSVVFLSAFLAMVLLLGAAGVLRFVSAAEGADTASPVTASPVELDRIDYSNMELSVKTNGNVIVYYSTNKTKWYEAEPVASTNGKSEPVLFYDISWISASTETTLYFRGNSNTTTLAVKIPGYNKSFKVKFDKAAGTFDFLNTEDAEVIRWRKQTDYNWNYVWVDSSKKDPLEISDTTDENYKKYGITGTIQSVSDFEKEIANLRVKGAKLIFQIAPTPSSTDSQGSRPSKDVKVSVTAKKTAPSMKVNIKKLTVNTRTKYEWTVTNPFTATKEDWKNCSKSNMALSDLAPDAVNGTSDVTLYFRSEATSSSCESKVTALTIPAREDKPTSPVVIAQTPGDKEGKGKATLTFSNVPTQGYEYTIVKSGTLDETKASWKKITKAKTVKFTEKSLPAGAKIYVRNAGIALNVRKGIDLKLPSKYLEQVVPAYTVKKEEAAK